MSAILEQAIAAIEAQQPKERNAVWMVGEQLKDMVIDAPALAEIVLHDLETPELSLANCEKEIKKYADAHKTGNFACVIPSEAEKIIRGFYGLTKEAEKDSNVVDLADFFGEV